MLRKRTVRPLNVQMRDTALESEEPNKPPIVHIRGPKDRPLYKVRIFLEGDELPRVRRATYRLHPTFPNPERTVRRSARNQNCQLTIWTWGLFTVTAVVEDRQGQTHTLKHKLSYDSELSQEGIRYVEG